MIENPAAPPAPPAPMPLEQALARLLAQAQAPSQFELVPTAQADGRVLAQDGVAARPVPPCDNAAMDGYALRCADAPEAGAELPVSQRIAAGESAQPLLPGTAARIFTGAPLPPGADAVVMQEQVKPLAPASPSRATAADLPRIRIDCAPQPGQSIRRRGQDIGPGQVVLRAGQRLKPAHLGLAASLGLAELKVAMPPRVALFSTGNELLMPGQCPPGPIPPGAIYDSNRFFLHALLQRLGCAVTDLGKLPDQRAATVAALREAAQTHTLIVTSGGVSVGEEDHVKPAVEQLGTLALWQIAMKPGKPLACGHIRRHPGAMPGEAHFIGLPGNPVSSFVTFLLLVRPFVLKLQGCTDPAPQPLRLPAHFDWLQPGQRREFLRVRRNAQGGLDLFASQSSDMLTSAAWADGLVDNQAGQTIAHGDQVVYWPLADWLA